MIGISGLLGQVFTILLALVLAPLLSGWVGQCRAWLQSRVRRRCCCRITCCKSSFTRM